MDNQAGLSLANGFMQGFNFMENHKSRQRNNARADERFEHEKGGWQREEDGRLISAFQEGLSSGHVDQDIMEEFGARFDVDWSNYIDPEFGQSIGVLEGTLEGKVSMKSPEFKKAFGRTFRSETNKGIGETFDGRTIKDKIVRGVVPSRDGQSLMVDLDILEDGPDGESWRSAPVTEGRSAGDDVVKQIPVEEAVKQLKGHGMIYRAVQKSPELQSFIRQLAAKNGTQLPKAEKRYGDVVNDPNLGMIQAGPNGEIKVLKGLETPEPVYSEPYKHPDLGWVQKGPNGKITPYKTTDDNGANYGEVINHPQLGLVQKDKDGKYVQFKDPNEKKNKGAGGGLDSSVMSQVQQTSRNFHGQFNPDGSFLGLPDKARKKYALAMERSEELINAGYPVFTATNIANLSVLDPLTPSEATEIAEREADKQDIDWGG